MTGADESRTIAILAELTRTSQEGLPVLHIASHASEGSRRDRGAGFLAGLMPLPASMIQFMSDPHGKAASGHERNKVRAIHVGFVVQTCKKPMSVQCIDTKYASLFVAAVSIHELIAEDKRALISVYRIVFLSGIL